MPDSTSNVFLKRMRLTALLAAASAAVILHEHALAAELPAAPKTFDTRYAAPSGATLTVNEGDNLQAALDKAQPGDTIVLQAGAKWTGPFKLPNKSAGNGWIYVVSSHLSNLPPPGTRVSPANAANMPKILARQAMTAVATMPNSHHFRFVGIEFAPVPGATVVYQVVTIGNGNASPETLPSHIVFDRCYVHGDPTAANRRGIEMDGAYVAVIDSYISDFQEVGSDAQGLWAYNTTGPLQIRNNYIEGAGENVMFGGADSRAPELVPADIEISNNYFFKPLSLLSTKVTVKNLLEFKSARRALVTGNTFENCPAKSQQGFAILVTPRNQGSNAPWSGVSDIAITGNTLINVGSGFNLLGSDWPRPSLKTERILIRDNIVGVTGLNGADGRAFQFIGGGSDYTIDHNTTITFPVVPASVVGLTESRTSKINNFVFTNNLFARSHWGFGSSGLAAGIPTLTANFTNWTFSKNVIVGGGGAVYPEGNFFPADISAVRFANYAGGNYTLAADSPYKHAGTDGMDIGANGARAGTTVVVVPDPPTNVAVK